MKGYEYQSDFDYELDKGNATLTEKVINTTTGAIRQNEHTLYMPRQKEILKLATSVGFKEQSRVDMSDCEYDTHYLYILRK